MEALEANKPKTAPYDTEAKVVRVEGSTAWVHIPGGVDETPVAMTINASAGDTVRVRVSGGTAWLIGNDTAPPTDDTLAKEAMDQFNIRWAKIGTAIIDTLKATGINADWIDTGALVIYDDDGNEIFRADKTGKIFRWNTENSQMDADGTITLKAFYDDREGGNPDIPAFTSTKDTVHHLSQGIYAVQLYRDIIKYGSSVEIEQTIYSFSTESDYQSFVENGDDESYAADIFKYDVISSSWGIKATDSANHTYFDLNWLAGDGYIKLGVDGERLIEPFWANLKEITSNTNMNSYTTPGTYRCRSSSVASSVTNAPFSEPFQCCVYKSGTAPSGTTGNIMQIAWNFSSSTTIKYRMYITNMEWSPWYGIQKEGVAYKTGTVTIASGTQSTVTQTINFSDVVPSGKVPYGVVLTLGSYQLPYINASGNVVTWISHIGNTGLTIKNNTTAWTNYNYYLTVFFH